MVVLLRLWRWAIIRLEWRDEVPAAAAATDVVIGIASHHRATSACKIELAGMHPKHSSRRSFNIHDLMARGSIMATCHMSQLLLGMPLWMDFVDVVAIVMAADCTRKVRAIFLIWRFNVRGNQYEFKTLHR